MKKRADGITLLEVLLVLILAAVIITVSVRRYYSIQWPAQVAGVQSDVATIMTALNQYFQNTGCRVNGIFNSTNLEPSLTDLGLEDMQRAPIVKSYAVKIVDSGAKIPSKKPLYQLQVMANVSEALNDNKIAGLKNELNASLENRQLIWSTIPAHNLADTGNSVWILQNSSRKFKDAQMQQPLLNVASSANCAE